MKVEVEVVVVAFELDDDQTEVRPRDVRELVTHVFVYADSHPELIARGRVVAGRDLDQ